MFGQPALPRRPSGSGGGAWGRPPDEEQGVATTAAAAASAAVHAGGDAPSEENGGNGGEGGEGEGDAGSAEGLLDASSVGDGLSYLPSESAGVEGQVSFEEPQGE